MEALLGGKYGFGTYTSLRLGRVQNIYTWRKGSELVLVGLEGSEFQNLNLSARKRSRLKFANLEVFAEPL